MIMRNPAIYHVQRGLIICDWLCPFSGDRASDGRGFAQIPVDVPLDLRALPLCVCGCETRSGLDNWLRTPLFRELAAGRIENKILLWFAAWMVAPRHKLHPDAERLKYDVHRSLFSPGRFVSFDEFVKPDHVEACEREEMRRAALDSFVRLAPLPPPGMDHLETRAYLDHLYSIVRGWKDEP